MDAVNAALLDAVRALLLAEAGGVGRERLGKAALGQNFADEAADHRVLARADEVEVLALDLVHHGVHVVLAHDALDHVAVDHERRDAECEALVDHKVARVGEHALVQARDVAEQVVEARAGDAARGVHVDAVEALHDLRVVGNFKIGDLRLAEALDLDVAAVVRADGDAGVDNVRNQQHDLVDLLLILLFELFKLGQAVGVRLDGRLDLFGLFELARVLLRLTHQHADLLREGVAAGAQLARLGDGGAVLGVELDDLVDEGELFVLELLLDVFLDLIGIFPQEFHIQHNDLPRYRCKVNDHLASYFTPSGNSLSTMDW